MSSLLSAQQDETATLGESIDAVEADTGRLDVLDASGLATEAWVQTQRYVTETDVANLGSTVEGGL